MYVNEKSKPLEMREKDEPLMFGPHRELFLQRCQVLRAHPRGTWPRPGDEMGSGTNDTEEASPGLCCLLTRPV